MTYLRLGFLLGCLCAAVACEEVDGGGVEVSWVLRSQGGYAIDTCACAEPAIAKIRLTMAPQPGQPDLVPMSYDFPCSRQRAATPFEVPPGRYQLQVLPIDAQGGVATAILTPPPQVRTIVWGQPASLDAQLIVAPCAPACANRNGACTAQ